MQTHLNGPQGPKSNLATLPLTPAYAKRLTGLLGVTGTLPVTWQGCKLVGVQVKRHPYDSWCNVTLAGQVDTQNHSLRFRAVVQCNPAGNVPATKDLVTL
jgi:hypothetical protein